MGVSRVIKNTSRLKGARVGTPLYLSPEIIKKMPYDFKIDIVHGKEVHAGCSKAKYLHTLHIKPQKMHIDSVIVLDSK